MYLVVGPSHLMSNSSVVVWKSKWCILGRQKLKPGATLQVVNDNPHETNSICYLV